MLYYYNGFRSTADWPYENKGYELRVLNWKQDVYISFIESFIKFYLCFINAINIFNQNCLSLQQKWPYINKKNICHQQWQQSDVNLACFTAITTLSFLNTWKHYINVLKLLKVYNQHKTIICFGLIVFLFKSLNVFNLLAATKRLITNYTFSVNSFMVEVPII